MLPVYVLAVNERSTIVVVEDQSIVMVPVPVDRLADVYRVLGSPSVAVSSVEAPAGGAWSPRDLARLHQELGPATAARAILDLGSATPGQRIWFGDVCTRVGRSHAAVRSELGGFTKLLKGRFGRDDWPFGVAWTDGRAWYTVEQDVARAWLGGGGQE